MSANSRTVPLKVGGKTYNVRFSTNALATFEEQHGDNFLTAMAAFGAGNVSFKTFRLLVWAALLDFQQLSLEEVGDLIDAAGFDAVSDAVSRAAELAFPQAEGGEGNGAAGKPG